MLHIVPQNLGGLRITATSSASLLYDLMDQSGSSKTSREYYDGLGCNALVVLPEDGDARILHGASPTATQGMLLKEGVEYTLTGIQLAITRIVRAGTSNVSLSVLPCKSGPVEPSTAVSVSGGGDTSLLATSANQTNGAQKAQVVDSTGANVDMAKDASVVLLRRIVKLMEASGNVDTSNRQKITVDAPLPAGSNTIGTVTVGTVSTVSSVTNVAGIGTYDPKLMFMEMARASYESGIRSKISFT